MSFFFLTPRLCCFFPFLAFFELGSAEHPVCCSVYLGQESSFMYMTPRQSRWTERKDEGRWWRTPTRSLWGHAPLSSFFFPLTYLWMHSNRLTNVPWKFTLDTGSRRSECKLEAAGRRLDSDVEAARTHLFFSIRSCWRSTDRGRLRRSQTLVKMWRFSRSLWYLPFLLPLLSLLFKAA